MAAVVIVGVQPDGEFVAAFGVGAVEPFVGPFVGPGAVEAFDAPLLSTSWGLSAACGFEGGSGRGRLA